jgi:hypothetical protein
VRRRRRRRRRRLLVHLMSGFVRRSAITYVIVRARWSMAWIRIASFLPVPVTL